MDSQHLQNVANVVTFCKHKQIKDHEAYSNVKKDIRCYFHLIKLKNMDHTWSWDYKKISKCCSMHSMVFISHREYTLLNVWDLACFYHECMDDNVEFY